MGGELSETGRVGFSRGRLVYDRIFGDLFAKNTVCTFIYGSGQPCIYSLYVYRNPVHNSGQPKGLIEQRSCDKHQKHAETIISDCLNV